MTDRTSLSHVDLLIDFANSIDLDEGTDDLTTPAELTRWLVAHGLLPRSVTSTVDDLALARRLRDALHEALVANHHGSSDGGALEAEAAHLPLRLSGPVDQLWLHPVHEGVRGALSHVLIAVASAVADDTWRRLKVCSSDECAWAYFDASKNRSRTWCEWGCGNRNKTRNYRARKKATLQRDRGTFG